MADVARKAQCSTLIVMSKWDVSTIDIEDTRRELARRLRQRPAVIAVSSKTGRGIDAAARPHGRALRQARRAHPDSGAEPLPRRAAQRAPAAVARGRRLNLLYGAQVRTRPPRFRFSVNDPSLITRDYGYWVENQLRERFSLEGVPVAIDFVRRS